MKDKKNLKKWEKIFIIISCAVIAISFFTYLYRFIHYYRIEHVKHKINTLIQEVTKNTVNSGDGLYILNEDNYFYKGINVDNYVWYSGNMYRIVSINKNDIKLISDDNLTVLAWGENTKFNESYLYTWLNNTDDSKSVFVDSIDNYQMYLKEFNYCNDLINKNCINKNTYISSLLTRSEYLNAGGKLSYLNNESNFWIIDDTNESEKAYVFKEGGISTENDTETLSSYGIRPVITINGGISNIEGTGTKDNPYIIKEELGNSLNTKKIGEYVTYKDYTFRVLNIEENGVKVVLDGTLNDVNLNFNQIGNYLNTFANNFNKLGQCIYYDGTYGSNSNYDYKNIYNHSFTASVGIQSIGDLYVSSDNSYWLYNSYEQNTDLAYKLNSKGTIIADTKVTSNLIRPVLCLNRDIEIKSGNGTKINPYVLED